MSGVIDKIRHDAKEIFALPQCVVDNSHLVYKAGMHGSKYIDKERLVRLGAIDMHNLFWLLAKGMRVEGFEFPAKRGPIGVIGPAYGAIPYALPLAAHLVSEYHHQFFPARTELETDATGKRVHIIPEKLRPYYRRKSFVIVDDIANNGTTISEVAKLLRSIGAHVVGAVCLVDRGGQTARALGIHQFFALLEMKMKQFEAKECPLCAQGIPINTTLGKGSRWVKLFGQPPYLPGTDFLAFWGVEISKK